MASGETSDWGSGSWGQEQATPQPTAGSRLREAFKNPALQERAKQVAVGVGSEALVASGVVKQKRDGSFRISKRGAIKAALNPHLAVAKAARGATSEARSIAVSTAMEARGDAIAAAKGAATEAFTSAVDTWGGTPATPAVEVGWGTPQPTTPTESWGGGWDAAPLPPAAPASNEWGSPNSWDAQPAAPSSPNDWGVAPTVNAGNTEWGGADSWGSGPAANYAPQAPAPNAWEQPTDWGAPLPPQPQTPDSWGSPSNW